MCTVNEIIISIKLVGTLLPEQMGISAALKVKIPFVGSVTLVELKGSLITGAEGTINLVLAKGTVKVSAKPNSSGKHDLYIDEIAVDIKFLKKYAAKNIRLVGLPYVHLLKKFPAISLT